jgi:hypothetical protein
MHSVYDDPAYASTVAELKQELKRLRELYRDDDSHKVPSDERPPAAGKAKNKKRPG